MLTKQQDRSRRLPSDLCFLRDANNEEDSEATQVDRLQILPVELLYEITSYLLPFHLLSLYRTSKYIRRVLESKLFNSIWVISRERMGMLPPSIPHRSEIWYASLLFEATCGLCGATIPDHKRSHIEDLEMDVCDSCYDASGNGRIVVQQCQCLSGSVGVEHAPPAEEASTPANREGTSFLRWSRSILRVIRKLLARGGKKVAMNHKP
ncbi:hypothetical protein K474DRAFT_1663014 [Panus rudis PR-1116 ss-1]|nr:hypothetical protein K474DRAFT_1663014 [Panus rudis PR-1116 ss-1]